MTHDSGRTGRAVLDGDGADDGATLATRVATARARRGMSLEELHRETGLSTRTLRDIEGGHPTRRYTPPTLARLDDVFGWAPGTAWHAWTQQRDQGGELAGELRDAIAAQMALLAERLDRIEEAPPWQTEVIDGMRLLRPDDRALVLSIIHRLGDTAVWR